MTHLTQTALELKELFSKMNISSLTKMMNNKEKEIVRQQRYITKCDEENNKNPDQNWINYKIEANDNLVVWDAMKAARDEMKTV